MREIGAYGDDTNKLACTLFFLFRKFGGGGRGGEGVVGMGEDFFLVYCWLWGEASKKVGDNSVCG